MSEQTDKMREMAQTTLDRAKEAVTKYMVESQKVREKVDSGVRSSYSNLKEMNDKAVAFQKPMYPPVLISRKSFLTQRIHRRSARSIRPT